MGGVYTELLNFGGGLDGIGQKWGGSASGARRAPNWYTPPPGMFMTPSLIGRELREARLFYVLLEHYLVEQFAMLLLPVITFKIVLTS